MPTITIISHEGEECFLEVDSGETIMSAAIDNGINAILAECGGACVCATCHCYIEFPWSDKLNPVSNAESELLDCVVERKDSSRLACQVKITEEYNGLVVKLPVSQI